METVGIYINQLIFIFCSILGGIAHYLKKYLKGETHTQIHEWFGPSNLEATIYTFIIFLFAIIGAIAADVITPTTNFWAAMYSGFVTGFAIDSGFNRDNPTSLTDNLISTKKDLNELIDKK